MVCQKCGYVMDVFDQHCKRCYSYGLAPLPRPASASVATGNTPHPHYKRLYFASGLLLLLTVGIVWCRQRIIWSRGTVVGTYWVPPLAGWQSKLTTQGPKHYHRVKRGKTYDFTTPYSSDLTFNNTRDGNDITVAFAMIDGDSKGSDAIFINSVKTAQFIIMMMGKYTNHPVTLLESKTTQFRGHPAYLAHTQDSFYQTHSDIRSLTFRDGTEIYTITSSVSGPTLSPQALTKAEQSWESLCQEAKAL